MKLNVKQSFCIFAAMLAITLVPVTDAGAEAGTCYLQATNTDVYIVVFDMDRDGNRGKKNMAGEN